MQALLSHTVGGEHEHRNPKCVDLLFDILHTNTVKNLVSSITSTPACFLFEFHTQCQGKILGARLQEENNYMLAS